MLNPQAELVIGERFELVRELARGGMGSVWLGQDKKLRRQVAIKLMVPLWAESTDARSRFEREAMAVAQLKSPHVVQVFDYGVQDGCPYIVMELLEGEDLRERLQREKRLTMEAAGIVLLQTAKALTIAHAANIIHRDLKPGNIFLARGRDEEIVKVLDFGVAKADPNSDITHEATRAGSVLGTPQFMSPEQARALPDIDARSDLWSLGVIMYRVLTGQLPFNGKSAGDVIVKICTDSYVPVSKLAPELPPEIDRFFEKALAREPADRFSTAREMAHAFFELLHVAPPAPISLAGAAGADARVSYPSLPAFTPSGLLAAAQAPAVTTPSDPSKNPDENPTTMRSGKIPAVRISNSQATLASALVSPTSVERPRPRRSLWIALGVGGAAAAAAVVAVLASGGGAPSPASASMPVVTNVEPTTVDAVPRTTAPAPDPTPSLVTPSPATPSASDTAEPVASASASAVAPPAGTPARTSTIAPTATHTATATKSTATTTAPPPPPPPTSTDPFAERL